MEAQKYYESKSVKDVALNYLVQNIISGKYKPKDKINEVSVAKKLGISRAPIREAIKELSSQGLVIKIPRKGTYVVELSEKDVKEIYQIRVNLESSIIDKIIENNLLKEKDFNFLAEKIAISDDDFNNKKNLINREDIKFHQYLWQKANSPRRLKILTALHLQLQMAMLFDTDLTGDLENTASTHKNILKYLKNGENKNAKKALIDHIEVYPS